jgi:peptidyl-Lys metalloendopeptidase
MRTISIVYELNGKACRRGALGYTFRNVDTIWLCDSFWAAPRSGADSRPGTLVHEHSHSAAQTVDLTYGRSSARNLAARSPDRAIRNADNYEYYAEG